MSVYNIEQGLRAILKAHELWLDNPCQAGAKRAILHGAKLERADLSGTNLSRADFSEAILNDAIFVGAILNDAIFVGAELERANLSGASLYKVNLHEAILHKANLTRADLKRVDLSGADLSGAIGILSPSEWLASHFEVTDEGYVVYKTEETFEAGDYLTEVCNPDRSAVHGTGVNFATYERCKEYLEYLPAVPIWKCIIEWRDLPGVVVPFNPEGQARCERLRLVESVS
jgi:hypothetical protein